MFPFCHACTTSLIPHVQSYIIITYLCLSLDSELWAGRGLAWITTVSLAHWVQWVSCSYHSIKMCQKHKLSLGQLYPHVTGQRDKSSQEGDMVSGVVPTHLLISRGPFPLLIYSQSLAGCAWFFMCLILYPSFSKQMLSNLALISNNAGTWRPLRPNCMWNQDFQEHPLGQHTLVWPNAYSCFPKHGLPNLRK